VFIFAVTIFKSFSNTKAVQQHPTISVRNATSSVEILKSEIVGGSLSLTVKNRGTLPIIAIGVTVEKAGYTVVDFTMHELLNGKLDPGVSEDIRASSINGTGLTTVNAVIDMAYFIDGSAEGKTESIRQQREMYEGVSLSLQQASSDLSALSNYDKTALEKTRDKIAGYPAPAGLGDYQSIGFKSGLNRAQAMINFLLQDAESSPAGNKDEKLNAAKTKINQLREKLRRRQ